MHVYYIGENLSESKNDNAHSLILITAQEYAANNSLFDFPSPPIAEKIHICKAETHPKYISGTFRAPQHLKVSFSYIITENKIVLCGDETALNGFIKKMIKEKNLTENSVGGFFCAFINLIIYQDIYHIQSLEDRLGDMEDEILEGNLNEFNGKISKMRKSISALIRYYNQLGDMVSEINKNENNYFNENQLRMMNIISNKIEHLESECQSLREYALQIRELFQAEIDIKQNRIMKILTIVTTVFLPLSILVGWYGMNFAYMPELKWRYGYPAIIFASIFIMALCMWIMKKKKFW